MKKLLTTLALSLLVIFGSVNIGFAAVIYDETTDRYVSTSEEDGVLSFGGTVFKADGTMYGLSEEDGQYLENIVPTDDKGVTTTVISVTGELNRPILNKDEAEGNALSIFNYTPEYSRVVFGWNDVDKNNIGTINIDIMNIETGKVIARGYNLTADRLYKVTENVKYIPLQIRITSKSLQRGQIQLEMGSSASKEAENRDLVSPLDIPVNTCVVTGMVPKNINGNQGQILASYTIVGTGNPQGQGHRVLKTHFDGSTNNMATINIGYEHNGSAYEYGLNIALGSYLNGQTSFGVGSNIDIRLSTNSNSGKATLRFREAGY